MEGLWSALPPDILERVLSFVPVPSLCRFRAVCQGWRELLRKPSFHDLCDRNGKKDKYLFVSRYLASGSITWRHVDPKFKRTLRFLDLDAGRSYSIETLRGAETEGTTRVLAMDDGLVCELNHTYRDTVSCTQLFISNPVTKTRRELPAPPIPFWNGMDYYPLVVPVVDKTARTFVVFLLRDYIDDSPIKIHLFDSTTKEWRDLKPPAEELEVVTPLSAVFFRGALYVLEGQSDFANLCIVSFNLEEDRWREVSVPLTACGILSYPELLVVEHRLMMTLWLIEPDSSARPSEYNAAFQVLEVLVDENSSRILFHIPIATLRDHFGESLKILLDCWRSAQDPIACVVPSIDSSGLCTSITLMSSSSGKLLRYDLTRGTCGGGWPAHLLRPGPFNSRDDVLQGDVVEGDVLDGDVLEDANYIGKHMELSLRDVFY